MHALGLLLFFSHYDFYLLFYLLFRPFHRFYLRLFFLFLFLIEEEGRILLKTVCIFSELAVYDSFRITGIRWTGELETAANLRLCFDLLIVNTGIPICPYASIRLDGEKRAARDGVKALGGMEG